MTEPNKQPDETQKSQATEGVTPPESQPENAADERTQKFTPVDAPSPSRPKEDEDEVEDAMKSTHPKPPGEIRKPEGAHTRALRKLEEEEPERARHSATRRLSTREADVLPMPASALERDPLEAVPWVVELRVVGTAYTIQVNVREAISIGRGLPEREEHHIDLTPYGALRLGVSRQHAVIAARKQFLTIQDLDSTNGTRVNNHLLPPGQPFPLEHGDEIAFGDLRVQLRFAVLPPRTSSMGSTGPLTVEGIPLLGDGHHIFVIEGDKDVALVYQLALEHAGYLVTVTGDPAQMTQLLEQWAPDAVIMDLILDDHTDVDLIHLLRNEPATKNVPLLVVSGMTGGHQMQKALGDGADAFLGKPVRLDELVVKLNDLITERALF